MNTFINNYEIKNGEFTPWFSLFYLLCWDKQYSIDECDFSTLFPELLGNFRNDAARFWNLYNLCLINRPNGFIPLHAISLKD